MTRVTLSALLAASLVCAQAPQPRPPSVSGVVINSANGQPVRKVSLVLVAKDAEHGISYEADADANGRFAFEDVAPGEYSLNADRQGFTRDNEGAPGAPLPSFKVEAGQPVTGIKVRLIPLGVITGRVIDADGDPVRGASVSAMEYSYLQGKKDLRPMSQATTNDKGEYRLFDLAVGKVYLRAAGPYSEMHRTSFSGGGRVVSGGMQDIAFFPSAPDVGHATLIELSAGAQLAGCDIRLRQQARYSIRGKLPGPFITSDENGNRANYMLQLVSRGNQNQGYSVEVDNENFTITDVAPGSYYVLCVPMNNEQHLSARQPVEVVNSDVDGVVLNLVPPIQVSGVLRVEGALPKPLEHLRVTLQADSSPRMPQMYGRRRFGGGSAEVKADGTFTFEDMPPDVYRITLGAHPGAYLKSVRLGDDDVTNGSVDLTRGSGSLAILLATDSGELEGTVKKPNGDPAVRVRVTLIAYGKLLGRGDLSPSGFTDEQGKFHLKNIAPGDYEIFAWEDVPVGAPQDPEFRKPFEKQAVALKMEPNGHQNVDLTSISVKSAQRADQ